MKHSYSYLVLLFLVMSCGLSAMDNFEIPSRKEFLNENALAKHPDGYLRAVQERESLAALRERAINKKESKEKPLKINWLSEFTGALAFALVVGVME